MKEYSEANPNEWKKWLHETRLDLTRADLDWVLHVGKNVDEVPGPLQAFNLSRPIWLDGLTQNEFMHTMRRVWLTKLSLIHRIKFLFGTGSGKPGQSMTGTSRRAKNLPENPLLLPANPAKLIQTRQVDLVGILIQRTGLSALISRLTTSDRYPCKLSMEYI